jgi:predicted nucleic acid-binding protein
VALWFLDTSALVRRYDPAEPGADRVRAICAPAPGPTLLISRITPVEVASALGRKCREGVLDAAHRDALWHLFWAHWRRQYHAVAVDEDVLRAAERLVLAHPLRAYDAVQIGCALRAARIVAGTGEPLRFLTADRAQAQAAEAERLEVELVGR